MATNPLNKPAENDTPAEPSGPSSSILLKQRRSSCSCSNIAIMQLFHEMKQKFPTVPDHVVSDLVTANCHNRPACIDSLEKAVLGTPASAQAYPSQSIHSTSLKRRINERKLSKLENSFSGGSSGSSSRESSVDKSSKCMGDATGSSMTVVNNNYNRLHDNTSTGDTTARDGGRGNCTDNHHATTTTTVFDSNNNRVALSRPNTLAFSGPRPTRVAPLPPISSTITASPELGETVNVQLNVTVSPVAGRSPVCSRHTSTLQLQPEAPFSRELAQASSSFNTPGPLPPGANSRSSTSVNLTLRQPSDSPQSPIHIHASPLKYTAKGFNAQSGIQSKLEITFRDGFGSISAMRTHVPGYEPAAGPAGNTSNNLSTSGNSSSIQYGPLPDSPHREHQQYLATAAPPPPGSNENEGLNRQQLHQNYLTEVAITHQLDQKNRLSEEVDRYRQQLKLIQREIDVLQKPLSRTEAEMVNQEVHDLEAEVDRMQKEVDSAELTQTHPAGVIDNLNALSIEGSPSHTAGPFLNRPPRPPRPPPPRVPARSQPATPAMPAPSTMYTIENRHPGRSNSAPAEGDRTSLGTGEQWTCSLCTFQNHELMTRCEVCSMVKTPGRLSSQASVTDSLSSSAAASLTPPPAPAIVASTAAIVAAPVASNVLLQSSPNSPSSAASSATSTPQAQPPLQNAQFQQSSIEC